MEARYRRGVVVFRSLFAALVLAQAIIWVLYGRGVTRGDFLSVAEGSLYALAFSAAAVCIWLYGQRASSVVLGVPLFGLNSRTLLSRTIMLQAVCCAGAFLSRAVASLAVAVAAALDVDDHLKEVSGEGIGISLVVFVCLDIAPAALILLQNRRALGRSRVPGPAKVLRPCVTALCTPCCWLRGRLSGQRGGSGSGGGQGSSLGRRQPMINADAPLIAGAPSLLSTGYGSRDSSSSQLLGSGSSSGPGLGSSSASGSAATLTTPLVGDSDLHLSSATAAAVYSVFVPIGNATSSSGAAAMPEASASAASLQHARAASAAAAALDADGALRSGRASVLSVSSASGGSRPLLASHSGGDGGSSGDLEGVAAAAAASGVSAAGVLPVFSSGADAATMLMAAGGSAAALARAAIAHAAKTAPGNGSSAEASGGGEGAAEPLLAHGEGEVDSGALFGPGYAGFDRDMSSGRRISSESGGAAGNARRSSAGSGR